MVKGVRLACPYCETHPLLEHNRGGKCLICPKCNRKFVEWDDKPSFIDRDTIALDTIWSEGYSKARSRKRWLAGLYSKLRAPRLFSRRKPHFGMLSALVKVGSFKALYVGYNQHFEDRIRGNLIQVDVVPKENVDIVAAGEFVPFPDQSFDLVVISGVIEHTQYPFKVVDEAYRLLKQGGKLYISSPWVYPFHGGDNYRFSHEGLKLLCNQFSTIEIGSLNGPVHSLGIFLYTFLIECLSFGNRYLRFGLSPIISWLVFPLLLIDALVNNPNKSKCVLDANIYAIAIKE